MATEFHRAAEVLLAQGEIARSRGNTDEARELFREAARTEARALAALSADQSRTRQALAVSAVALYRRAGSFDDGLRLAYRLLGSDVGESPAASELEELLDDLRAARAVATRGLELVRSPFEWILRGPSVAGGFAPLDSVNQKIGQIEKLGIRIFEYLLDKPLRKSGPPDPDVDDSMQILITAPASGSFRFGLSFATEIEQLTVFDQRPQRVSPDDVAEAFARVMRAAREPDHEEELASVVRAEDYRDALLKLVRNLVPDGKKLREVELRRVDRDRTVVTLVPGTGTAINRYLRDKRPPPQTGSTTYREVLRGLDLNQSWIRLGRSPDEVTIHVPPELAIEDVIGPLVNHRVEVPAHFERNHWVADDILPEQERSEQEPLLP